MKRVLIIGPGGAGKSTLGRRLGEITGLPVVHLDRLYWQPNWTKLPPEEWAAVVEREVARERWILDGNFGGTLDIRLGRADTIILLDLPRLVCLARVVRRRLAYHRTNRPDMAAGCDEKLDLEFLLWIWNYRRRHGAQWEERLRAKAPHARFVRLASRRAVEEFCEQAKRRPAGE